LKKAIITSLIIASMALAGCSNVSIVSKETPAPQTADYLLASDSAVITEVDLSKLNDTELRYAYEEIFARHGKIYSDANYEKYFNSKDWYTPDPSFTDSDLTALELENSQFILGYINSKEPAQTPTPEPAPNTGANSIAKYDEEYYYRYYKGDNTYIIPDSSIRKLSARELYGYSSGTLALIRNEIYARNGYVFTKQKYKDYFSTKAWYRPNVNFNESWLTEIEKYNVQLIKSME